MKKICSICEQKILSEKLYTGDYDEINVSGIYGYGDIPLRGHKKCLENINRLVVLQNRLLSEQLLKEVAEKKN
jgi:hypothetical protein